MTSAPATLTNLPIGRDSIRNGRIFIGALTDMLFLASTMRNRPEWLNVAAVGALYFALAAISILTTRFDGGLAYLWVANALLITVLLRRPRRRWRSVIVASSVGSVLATGVVGAGWAMAPFLAVGNMTEVVVSAYLLRRARSSLLPLGSIRWNANLIAAAGIAGPLAMAAIAVLPAWAISGQAPLATVTRVLIGHGLSNLTFIPIMKLFATGNQSGLQGWRVPTQRRTIVLLFLLFVAVTIGVFSQNDLPLLFLPMLPLLMIVFRSDSRCTAAGLLILAVIASAAVILGKGPVHLVSIDPGRDLQLTAFYLVTTVFTIVPIAAQLRRAERLAGQVRSSEARYRMLADHSGDIIMLTDAFGVVTFVSPSIERAGGYRPVDLIGRNCLEIVHPADHETIKSHYHFALTGTAIDTRFEYRARRRDGEWRWFESDCRGLVDATGERGVISMIRDIGERKAREEQLALAAMTDPLTGLLNRRAFREAAARAAADQQMRVTTIALLDIDHFKQVNDRYGHDAGDEVLQSFAATAQTFLHDGDVMARLGGEEFAILLPGTDDAGAMTVCERLRHEVATSLCLTPAGPIRITISGGVSALGADGIDAALKRADLALYRAKNEGRDRLAFAAAA